MSKTTRFDIHSDEPSGTTFAGNRSPKLAGSSNTKRKASFGINDTEPQGITFSGNKSHISLPNANKAPRDLKTISESTGTYSPEKVKARDFGGSVGVKGPGKK